MNELADDDSYRVRHSPTRWLLAGSAIGNVLVGVWLVDGATEADGTWAVGWRLGLAVFVGLAAIVQVMAGTLGLADNRRPLT